MPTISKFADLLAMAAPYLASPEPIAAMRRDGFTFGGEVGQAIARRKPANPLTAADLQRLEQAFGPALPARLHIGRLPALPPAPPPESGFRGIASFRLDAINPVLAELWTVGTIPRQLTASVTADLIDLPTLRQLCNNVPTAADASLGPLRIASPPVLHASSTSGNLHIDIEFELPVLGAQPASLEGALHVELPLGLEIFTLVALGPLLRLRLALDGSGVLGAVATLQIAVDSAIVPNSSASQSAIESKFTAGVRLALLTYSADGTLSVPVQKKLNSFPNTVLAIKQAGAVTINRDNESFIVLGFNTIVQQQVDASGLMSANTPLSPFDLHVELAEAGADDILNAFVESGDLGAYVTSFANPPLGLHIDCTGGNLTFRNGNLTLTVGFVARDLCIGLDVNFTVQASGPPIISNGQMRIGAQYVDISVDTWDELVCYLVSSLVPLGTYVLTAALAVISGRHDAPTNSIDVSPSLALPGSDVDWELSIKQAAATNGTLVLDGSTALIPDPRMFVYLRILEQARFPLRTEPLANARVTLFELDDPAPAGDDVAIPHTGTKIDVKPKFIIETSTTFEPSPDQTLGTLTTDQNGDVLFIINTAASGGLPVINYVGGIVTTSKTQTDNFSGRIMSSTTTHSSVSEEEPDFGVSIADASGMVRATRHLVALNVVGNRVGSKDHPVVVEVPLVLVNAP